MSEELRQLLYPLGFLSSVAFSLRFLVQWIYSEKRKKSSVSRSFWLLSLFGNLSLLIHSAIQLQYPICVIQALNAVISLRNLNLMHTHHKVWKIHTVWGLMMLAFALPTLGFWISSEDWLRVPVNNYSLRSSFSVSLFWHIIGALGILLFALRFWLQWFEAEKKGISTLSESFWWLSLVGALLSLLYFFFIGDLVNLLGPLFGIIPYIRNLMLLKEKKAIYGRS
ncbi:hypothetical protein PHSC3_000189 [Chlamydiales bacterium STE3]|nr:hypothetical protein PHSC3_000189 [Chlamydiales bacterium STE3]